MAPCGGVPQGVKAGGVLRKPLTPAVGRHVEGKGNTWPTWEGKLWRGMKKDSKDGGKVEVDRKIDGMKEETVEVRKS